MSNVTYLPIEKKCDGEAGLWIAKVDRGLSQAEKDELGQWLSAAQANYHAFIETADLWDQMDAIAMLSEIYPKLSRRRTRGFRYALPIAATVLLSVATAILYMATGGLPDISSDNYVVDLAPSVYSTAIGEQATVELADGSSLVLNTNSLVSVYFTNVNRLLVMERGEIHVVVAHDPSRPLSVVAGDQVVQAVGTEFNVEISSDRSIELVVTEGLVMIGVLETPFDELPNDQPIKLPQSSTMVAGGQEAIIRHVEETIQKIETKEIATEEIAVKLSWRDGNLVFRGETLEEAMIEVGRYTAVEFVFLDEESKKEQVAGFFKAGDVDGLLAVLRKHFNISYQWIGDDKVVLEGDDLSK